MYKAGLLFKYVSKWFWWNFPQKSHLELNIGNGVYRESNGVMQNGFERICLQQDDLHSTQP
jgi:hypothetical protein